MGNTMQSSAATPIPRDVTSSVPKRSLSALGDSPDTVIAIITTISIATYLALHYGFHSGAAVVALYIPLIIGGIPIVVRLVRSAIRGEFGSDLLAGFSIITAVVLKEYLVAVIIVLM